MSGAAVYPARCGKLDGEWGVGGGRQQRFRLRRAVEGLM